MKKIIGLTSQYNQLIDKKVVELNNTYVKAVEKAGALPVIIPILENRNHMEKYMDMIDGLIITGGSDISPLRFGESPIKETNVICHDRDDMEFKLLDLALEKSIPIMGICRGLQLTNIAFGGTSYQDIPSQIPNAHGHNSDATVNHGYHEIELIETGYLYEIFKKDKIIVNSLHHQCIKVLGKNLKVAAVSKDGIIEAIESTDNRKVYGVQFHPESLVDNKPEFLEVFKYFINQL